MKKFLTFLLIIILNGVFTKTYALDDDAILKFDFRTAYQSYNAALKQAQTAENYLNMCKVTFLLRDDDNAKIYCKSALNVIEKEKNPDLELKSNIFAMLGSLYSTVYHNNSITVDYLNQAKELKEANPDTDKYELAKVYRNLAYIYNYTGNSVLADDYYKKALAISENEKDNKYDVINALIYNDLALIERRKQNYSASYEYLVRAENAIEAADEYTNYSLAGAVYRNIARYFEYNKHSKKTAVEYYKKSTEAYSKFPGENLPDIIPVDSYNLEELTAENELYPYSVTNNLKLGIYYTNDDFQKAEEYFKKAVDVNPQNAFVYLLQAKIYEQLYTEALKKEREQQNEEEIFENLNQELLPAFVTRKLYSAQKDAAKYLRLVKQYAKTAEEKGKYNPNVYFSLWDIYMKINKTKEAERCIKEFIKYSDNRENAVKRLQNYAETEKISLPKDTKNDILN